MKEVVRRNYLTRENQCRSISDLHCRTMNRKAREETSDQRKRSALPIELPVVNDDRLGLEPRTTHLTGEVSLLYTVADRFFKELMTTLTPGQEPVN